MRKSIITKIISIALVLITVFSVFAINASAAPSYNVNNAVKYAQKYTDSSGKMSGTYNSKYNVYKPTSFSYYGYDCANFVSQCLYAGGLKESKEWKRVLKKQNYKNIDGGVAWVNAPELFRYLKSQGFSYEVVKADLSNIHKGDVVFMDFNNDGKVNHSTICTGKSGKTPYYCAHSSWRKNYKYSTDQWAGGKAYVVHMSNCKESTVTTTKAPALKSHTVGPSNGVTVRTGAGTGCSKVGGISKGSKIYYTQTKKANGYIWAKIEKGTYKSGTWGKTTGYWVALL